MKKIFNSLFVIIAAMVTFAGCAKEDVNAPATSETKTIQFFAESIETKTAFGETLDGTSYPTLWTANDKKVQLLLNLTDELEADIEVSDDFATASFNAEVKTESAAPYQFAVISPASAYLSRNEERFAVTIPTTQKPLANSVDESAQILYAVSDSFDELPESVSLQFKHFTAYGNLSFVNLNLGNATVTSVAITSSVDFANRWNYFIGTETFGENSGASTITLETTETENLWFACAPIGSLDGVTLTFTVNTDKGPLTRPVALSGDKYKFEAGRIAKMTVDMSDIEFAKSKVYELVTDASDLTVDSEVIIVATDYNQALSTTQNSNNRGQAAVTKSTDKATITDPGNDVQVITIEDGTIDGTVAFNVGNGYLCAASSSSNYLRTETDLSANSSWSVEISGDGVATIKAQGTYTRNWIRYNSTNNTGPIFSCYGSGQKDVAIYKLQGSGSAPLPKLTAPTVTAELNADETGIEVSWTEVENATSYVISGVGEDVTVTEGTSYSFEELSSGTYTITVTAKADGYKSAAGVAESVTVPYINTGEAKTYTLTIISTDLQKKSGSGYAAYNGSHTLTASAADGSTMSVEIMTSQVMPGTSPSNTLQFQASKGTLYNVTDLGTIVSVEYDVNKGTGISATIGSQQNPSTETAGGSYFVVKKTTSGAGYLNSVTITFEK